MATRNSQHRTPIPALHAEEVMGAFSEVAPEILLAGATRPNRCILATRVTVEVFRNFGLPAEPMVVRGDAMNSAFSRVLQEAATEDWSAEEVETRLRTAGGYSVGLGYAGGTVGFGGGRGFPGHLVAIVGDMLVDSSIIQAHRPERGIELPFIVAIRKLGTTSFMAGTEPLWAVLEGGTAVLYYRLLPAPGFEYLHDWYDERRWGAISREIIRAMDPLLA